MPQELTNRTLTDEDIKALTEAFHTRACEQCSLGFTSEEVTLIKRFLKSWDSSTKLIGRLVLTFIVLGLLAVFTKGFWMSLVEGVAKNMKQ